MPDELGQPQKIMIPLKIEDTVVRLVQSIDCAWQFIGYQILIGGEVLVSNRV